LSQEVYLAIVLEVLQSIRQAEIAQLLSRIYGAPGGTEALDVLMKYMYDALSRLGRLVQHLQRQDMTFLLYNLLTSWTCSYKGMAQAAPASSTRNITPQATGFSQVHSRGGGEGGGQAMSVLLSWHEKVRHLSISPRRPHRHKLYTQPLVRFPCPCGRRHQNL